jgi:Flagellar assembly protein FliH
MPRRSSATVPDLFIPMRDWLSRTKEPETAVREPVLETEIEPVFDAQTVVCEPNPVDDAIGEVKRFRAALEDAVACRLDELLRDIASDVLARELALAPCDVRAIVAQTLARHSTDAVRVRVNPHEVAIAEPAGIPVVADEALRAGDAVIETRCGTIDASFGVRLDRILSAFIA